MTFIHTLIIGIYYYNIYVHLTYRYFLIRPMTIFSTLVSRLTVILCYYYRCTHSSPNNRTDGHSCIDITSHEVRE